MSRVNGGRYFQTMKSYDQIEQFIKLLLQIDKLLKDFTDLSKKKPNDAVNKFKIQFVNKLLIQSNGTLTKKHIPFDDFTEFDEDDLPTNSDVLLIISQYDACLKNFGREKHNL